jgi:hypothetical protein
MNVGEWLRSLRLEQYERAFRENDIDAQVVLELTTEDLIGLGVTSIGHRRKLLGAIAALIGQLERATGLARGRRVACRGPAESPIASPQCAFRPA